MDELLNSEKVQGLEIAIEEATRSTEEGVKRFIEPAHGTLSRALAKRPHIVFGRRGSGKSSLLRKAAADLTVDRRPIAFVDLETFKGHSYPDVLISILIQTFERFEQWLDTAAVNPATKTSFWNKLFGTKPKRPPFDKQKSKALAERLKKETNDLKALLHSEDQIATVKRSVASQIASESASGGGKAGLRGAEIAHNRSGRQEEL